LGCGLTLSQSTAFCFSRQLSGVSFFLPIHRASDPVGVSPLPLFFFCRSIRDLLGACRRFFPRFSSSATIGLLLLPSWLLIEHLPGCSVAGHLPSSPLDPVVTLTLYCSLVRTLSSTNKPLPLFFWGETDRASHWVLTLRDLHIFL